MKLIDTVQFMLSSDYKDRFKAEYEQAKIRHDSLQSMIEKYENGSLDFEPTCEISLLKEQLYRMEGYIYILEARARVEGIEL